MFSGYWFTHYRIFCILGEIQEGTLTDEMMFENGKLVEPCDFCSPQVCTCTYEQYLARMKKEVIVVI
jgi:hypothetical protein